MLIRLLSVLAVFCMSVMPAQGHDWYPNECCHDRDCAPVLQTRVVDGALQVTSAHGTGTVPADMVRRESKDHRAHVCMHNHSYKGMEVICYFVPPSN